MRTIAQTKIHFSFNINWLSQWVEAVFVCLKDKYQFFLKKIMFKFLTSFSADYPDLQGKRAGILFFLPNIYEYLD